MRARPILMLLVLLPLLATPAAATLVVQAPGAPVGVGMNPQLVCAIVHETAGVSRCDVVGGVSRVRNVLVSVQGMSDLSVLVVDEANGRQLHSGPCATTCRFTFDAEVTSPRVRLAVFGHGVGPGAYAVATVQAGDPYV